MARLATDLVHSCFFKQYNQVNFTSHFDYYSHYLDKALGDGTNPALTLAAALPWLKPLVDFVILHCFNFIGTARKEIRRFTDMMTELNLRARKEMASARAQAEADNKTFDPENFVLKDGTRFKRNMIDAFIDNYNDGKVEKEDYHGTILFLILAGIKTSNDTAVRILYNMASHMDIQEKLRRSILEDGTESEYLTWCINEALRVDSPAPIGCSRTADRDLAVEGGGVIPAGTYVVVPAHTIHRMPEYWGQDAAVFRPERWAEADGLHPMQYIPFGAGARVCPGREFAMTDLKKMLVALLTRYRLERCAKTSDSPLFNSPCFIYSVPEVPTYIRFSRLTHADRPAL